MLHKKLRLIGYIRCGGTDFGSAQQRRMIQKFCDDHGHTLVGFSETDGSVPGYGLHEAIDALGANDGIIAIDLDRFVRHHDDRLLDLRPLIENMLHNGKVLITLLDGIETLTARGQQVTLDLLNSWSERAGVIMSPTLEGHRSEQAN